MLPSRPSRAFDYSGLHRIANARRVRIPIQQAQRLQGQALHRTPQDNMSNHFKFGGINSKFLERINFADERVHKKDQHARQSKTSDGKSKPTAEFSRDLVSCVKKLDSLPSNLTDTKEQRPSMRDHQSHTASFRRRNQNNGAQYTHAHSESFRRRTKTHNDSFSRRTGHGSSFRKVKIKVQQDDHTESLRRKAQAKSHGDSFRSRNRTLFRDPWLK